MLVKRKLNLQKIIAFLFVMYSVWNLYPYFTWDTYANGVLNSIMGIPISVLIFFVLLITIVFSRGRNILVLKKSDGLIVGLAFVCLLFLYGFCGNSIQTLFSISILSTLVIILFFFIPENTRILTYKYFYYFFCVSLLISLVFYLLNLLGLDLSMGTLQPYEEVKVQMGSYYKHYFGGVQLYTTDYILNGIRFQGIYDEAGRLGVLCALFLAAEGYSFKKKTNILILISGLLTFTLSFYMLMIVYFIIYNILSKRTKNALILLLIIVAYFAFMNISFNNSAISLLQSRMQIGDTGLIGDNRTNAAYDAFFNSEFQNANMWIKLFGHGHNSYASAYIKYGIGGSTYKNLLYDYGFIGVGLFVSWILSFSYTMIQRNKKDATYILSFVFMYVINLYQRPCTFYPGYLMILLSGVYYYYYEKRENI